MASSNVPQQPAKQTLKYLLVLDFEATCGNVVKQMEIIEFPTLIYDLKEGELFTAHRGNTLTVL